MATNDELIDRYVLVHPELPFDPAYKQNASGIIVSADIEQDNFILLFQDDTKGLYSSDALLVLKPVAEIQQFLIDQAYSLSFLDLKILTHLDLTRRYGTGDKEWHALQMAAGNPGIQPYSLDLLKDILSVYYGDVDHPISGQIDPGVS